MADLVLKVKMEKKKVVLIKSPVRSCKFYHPAGRKFPYFPLRLKGSLIFFVTCFLYSLHLYWYVVLQSFFSTHSSLHSYLYVQPFLLNLSFGHSCFLPDLPSLYKSCVRGSFEDINTRWWEVMERSWCHDWVTSPCFLQWQFLSLVVRRLWGMSAAPPASHTPVINTSQHQPTARPPRG